VQTAGNYLLREPSYTALYSPLAAILDFVNILACVYVGPQT